MKKHLKTKILVAPVLMASILTPVLISSCASVSQYYLPVMIGGIGKGPYSSLSSAQMTQNDNIDGLNKSTTGTYNSPAATYNSYLPDSYITYTSRSKSGSDAYAWTNPTNTSYWNSDTSPTSPIPTYDYGWYDTANSKMSFQNSEKMNGEDQTFITSMQNWNISASIQTNTAIAAATGYISNGLTNFMTQPGIIKNKSSDQYYNALFDPTATVSFNHGAKDTDDNKAFYEFLFDNADLLGQGKTKAKFSESGAQFNYASSSYGPGTFITPSNEGYPTALTDFKNNFGSQQADMPDLNWTALPYKMPLTDGVMDPNEYLKYPTMYSHTTFVKDKDEADGPDSPNAYHPAGIGASIPFLIRPGSNQYSFYNPLKNLGMNPNDYLLNDLSSVTKEIKNTNVWKSFPDFVGSSYKNDKSNWAASLSWNVNAGNTYNGSSAADTPIFTSFTDTSATNDIYTAVDAAAKVAKAADPNNPTLNTAMALDPSVIRLLGSDITDGIRESINQDTYIGFANYSFIRFPKFPSGATATTYDYLPVFAGIQTASNGLPAVFPLELLTTINNPDSDFNSSSLSIDPNVFTAAPIPELAAIHNNDDLKGINIKGEFHKEWPAKSKKYYDSYDRGNNIYYLNIDKLAEKESNWLSFINQSDTKHKIQPNDSYESLTSQQKRYLSMLGIMYGKYDASLWQPVASHQLLQRIR